VSIAGGYWYTVALKSDGTLWAWGNNLDGQLGDGTNEHRYSPVQIKHLPIADPGGPYSATEDQAIMLDGSGSFHLDGPITTYEWDINNDGTYDYTSASPTQSHTYARQGAFTIKLRVTDNNGATNTATTTADISDTSPSADFTGSQPMASPSCGQFHRHSSGRDQPEL
jgi:hypothetical protein